MLVHNQKEKLSLLGSNSSQPEYLFLQFWRNLKIHGVLIKHAFFTEAFESLIEHGTNSLALTLQEKALRTFLLISEIINKMVCSWQILLKIESSILRKSIISLIYTIYQKLYYLPKRLTKSWKTWVQYIRYNFKKLMYYTASTNYNFIIHDTTSKKCPDVAQIVNIKQILQHAAPGS